MAENDRSVFAWWIAATIFVSAFLLFQVQPMISKMILPWFGGSPAVWTTCMLFFQVLLLAGYAYADAIVRLGSMRWQSAIHGPLLLLALLILPVTPSAAWKPGGEGEPTWAILLLLLANVGLPYFLLSSTGPLLQAWFADYYGASRSPYRLFALSNVGSLGALLTYPVVVEPALTTRWQGLAWSSAFALYALMSGIVLTMLWKDSQRKIQVEADASNDAESHSKKRKSGHKRSVANKTGEPSRPAEDKIGWGRYVQWICLPALASVLLLAVTARLSQDVAVVPFMWVIPLALYLLTFIICFERERWYSRRWISLLAAISVLLAANVMLDSRIDELYEDMGWPIRLSDFTNNVLVESSVYLFMLFGVCMLCHGEVARSKPVSRKLTRFYLSVATGGATGGVLVAVVFPQVFDALHEWNLAMLASFILGISVAAVDAKNSWFAEKKLLGVAAGLAACAGLVVVGWAQLDALDTYHIYRTRNFYGVLTVREHFMDDPELAGRGLYHGRILHGYQFDAQEKRREPTTYFERASGVGLAMRALQQRGPLQVGIVGLGTGTLAAYGTQEDSFRFYEINPDIETIAREYFTFLSDSDAAIEVVLGDARVSLEREEAQRFDLLVLDAFSGDSIPTHLLTREAFDVYERHLKSDGILAVHTSNRYLELAPVVVGAAEHLDWETLQITTSREGSLADASSDWILASPDPQQLDDPLLRRVGQATEQYNPILWTDHFSNLFEILQ